MSETFPRDIARKAEVIAGIIAGVEFVDDSDIRLIARAIAAERERCAKIAGAVQPNTSLVKSEMDGFRYASDLIADAIRTTAEKP